MKKLILILAIIASVNVVKAETPILQKSAVDGKSHIEFKYYGLYGVVGYDCLPALSINGAYPKPVMNGATGVIGFQFRRQSAIGIGVSYFADKTGLFSQMPLFLEFRSHYLRSRVTPYSAVKVGYSFALGSRYQQGADSWYIDKGGVMLGVEVGGRLAITHKFGMSLGVGYMLLHSNNVEYCDANMVPATNESVLMHNLKISLALNF